MRYWGFLFSKLLAVAVVFYCIWLGLNLCLPEPTSFSDFRLARFAQDLPWTFAIMVFWLAALGAVALVAQDQRYRCRTCLRKLRMPVGGGAWDKIFRLGAPQVEWICPFGHGTLKVFELHFTGRLSDDWREHDADMWRELELLDLKK